MIKVDRDLIAEPAALTSRYRGKTEQQRAIDKFEKHVDEGKDPLDFKFNFAAYSKKPLKKALTALFHGKCAYCESRYAGSQPMDVEHWRPKGQVDIPGRVLPGYYWLAATWKNLLPSCIDCNRSREQYDRYMDRKLQLGKETQFPVLGNKHLVTLPMPHEHDPKNVGGDEVPLLVNPCVDEPSKFFSYRDGLVLPKSELTGTDLEKAENSIIVYALNRSGLVYNRLAIVRLIDQRIFPLERLLRLDSMDVSRPVRLILDELIAHEIDCLVEMKSPQREYSAMASQLLLKHAQRLGVEGRLG